MAIPLGRPIIQEAGPDWCGDFASAFEESTHPTPGSEWQAYTPHIAARGRVVQLAHSIVTDAMGYKVDLENQRDERWLECLAATQKGIARGYAAGKKLVESLTDG